MRDDLLGLNAQVNEALAWLHGALDTASECCTKDDGSPNGWVAMEEVAKRLDCALRLLERSLEPVRQNIRKAQEWHDEMADRTDAAQG
jgi:hypothetical protein